MTQDRIGLCGPIPNKGGAAGVYCEPLLSGYKANRFNWLAESSKSSRESDG